jgi:hypothetical protein
MIAIQVFDHRRFRRRDKGANLHYLSHKLPHLILRRMLIRAVWPRSCSRYFCDMYTWGKDSYDGLGDVLQEGGDDLNDETFDHRRFRRRDQGANLHCFSYELPHLILWRMVIQAVWLRSCSRYFTVIFLVPFIPVWNPFISNCFSLPRRILSQGSCAVGMNYLCNIRRRATVRPWPWLS